jgi:hypothetical protein
MQKLTLAALSSAALFMLAACDRPNDTAQIAQAPRITFESVDKNGDGHITPQEALAVPTLDFNRMDADKNMSVTPDEFATSMAMARPRG